MNVAFVSWCLALALLSLGGCAQTATTYQLHYDINNPERQTFQNTLLIFPADIATQELFPGGVIEDIPSWTSATNEIITKQLEIYLASRLGIHSKILRDNSNSSLVHNHTVLLKWVNRAIRKHTRGWNTWTHKQNRFDYTIGPGLNFLRNQDVDTALYITGAQMVQVAKFDDTLTDITSYPSNQLTFGQIHFDICLVDLDTGDILWSNIDNYTGVDLRQTRSIRKMLAYALKSFPVSIFGRE